MWSIILPDGKHDCLETYLRQPEIVLFLVDQQEEHCKSINPVQL